MLDDPFVTDAQAVKRVVFCSGKVVWDAMAAREKRSAAAAIVRVEQLYPFPAEQMREVLDHYPNTQDVVWLQEEPDNMGPWSFVHARFHRVTESGLALRLVSRIGSGSPATGTKAIHDLELVEMMDETFRD